MAIEVVLALSVTLFSVLYYLLVIRTCRVRAFIKQVGGPPQYPVVGNGLDLNVSTDKLLRLLQFEWPRKYGPRLVFGIGSSQYFTSTSPSDLEKILSSQIEIEKSTEYKFAFPWLGDGLLLSKGRKWYKHRKMLTSSFHFKILEDFMPVFNEKSKIFVEKLRKDSEGGEKILDIQKSIALCALDIICETAMGKPINAQEEEDSEYVKAVNFAIFAVQYHFLIPWLHIDFVWNYLSQVGRKNRKVIKFLHEFTEYVIEERRKEMLAIKKDKSQNVKGENDENFSKKKRAFLDTLLEVQANDPNDLTDLQIREETDTFMFEGYDTTTASMVWTILALGSYPECQNKVIEELDRIFGGDKERLVTTADLAQAKYLEYCIKESLRLYPSVPLFARHLQQDLKLDDELTIPAGINVAILTLAVHRNPEIYPDPEAFTPERFAQENASGRHPDAYVPFSAGPRNCIGQKFALMEEKVVLANFFRNFRVKAVNGIAGTTMLEEGILRAKEGLKVKLTPC